jgi:two-component system CheB/CheR fusion protein
MANLIASQVGPYAAVDGVRVRPDGPDVELGAPVAHALGMVLHELATNAAKYGALSKKQGHVKVVWRLLEDGHQLESTRIVELEWIERDGPPVAPPSHKGFGTRMIESSLSYSLGGSATLYFEETGLRARIRVAVEADYG